MGQVTHQQAELLLRLYDLRRESKLREARAWFMENFSASSIEEAMQKFPPNSDGNVKMRMVVSYWEMACNLANRGLIDDEFFFENTGEQWVVWEKMKPIIPAWRAAFQNPHMFSQLEESVKRLEAWRERRAPGSNEAMRKMFAQFAQTRAQAAR
ncbi:MAG: DUF4760 domain-containing protein [Candidatus Acidiferrales bacterium]